MKSNTNNITGVFHQPLTDLPYNLRRYWPEAALKLFVEQFWFVDWQLTNNKTHTQVNLPDPNFHLVVDRKEVKVIAPVSKKYSYTMEGNGEIIGVKFVLGALNHLLKREVAHYIDQELSLEEVFDINANDLITKLANCDTDEARVKTLSNLFSSFMPTPSPAITQTIKLVALIKDNTDITTVNELANFANLSNRTIQRRFRQCIGMSPKWIIRKYRLHQALEGLASGQMDIADIAQWLGYVDQSHLIRDFKAITGVTPQTYLDQTS